MRWIGLGILVLGACSGAAAGPTSRIKLTEAMPLYREFGAWVLACDNVRTCTARYANPRGDGNDGYLSFSRDAGPSGAARLAISHAADRRLKLDGRPIGRFPWAPVHGKGRGQQAVLEGAAALKFMRAVRDGRELSYNSGGSVVALDSLKEALSAMDDAQGRSGSETALVEVGAKPASAVPVAPPMPVVHAVPTRAVLAKPHAFAEAVRAAKKDELDRHDCDLDVEDDDLTFVPDAGHVVVFLACNVGAYNLAGVLFIAPRTAPDQARLLVLPTAPAKMPADPSPQSVAVYYWNRYAPDTGWDAKTATFRTRATNRGRGDCGERSAWTFDGKDFQPTRYDKLDVCGGGPAGDWPTLYRAKVVVR